MARRGQWSNGKSADQGGLLRAIAVGRGFESSHGHLENQQVSSYHPNASGNRGYWLGRLN